MKYKNKKLMFELLVLFLAIQLIGLAVGVHYFSNEFPYGIEAPKGGNIAPVYFFGLILVATAIFLLALKLNLRRVLLAWIFLAYVISMALTLSVVFGELPAILIAITLLILFYKERDEIVRQIVTILLFPGLASLFVPMFNIRTFWLVLAFVSIYDVVSVFWTKHMVTLVRSHESLGIIPGIVLKEKREKAVLGGGDIILPLIYSIILIRDFSLYISLTSVLLSSLAVVTILLLGKRKQPYPAVPVISAFLLPTLLLI